jgi:hypothetical protein
MSLAERVPPRVFTSDPIDPEEEARRICQSALTAVPAGAPSLLVRVGGRSTIVVRSVGDRMVGYRVVSHGPATLAAAQAEAASASGAAAARMLRMAAEQVAERARLESLLGILCPVQGTAGIARAVITLASSGSSKATLPELHEATETLAANWVDGKRTGRLQAWIQPMMVGSAVLAATLDRLGAREILAQIESPLAAPPQDS